MTEKRYSPVVEELEEQNRIRLAKKHKRVIDTSQLIVAPEQYNSGYYEIIFGMRIKKLFTLIRQLEDGNYLVQSPGAFALGYSFISFAEREV